MSDKVEQEPVEQQQAPGDIPARENGAETLAGENGQAASQPAVVEPFAGSEVPVDEGFFAETVTTAPDTQPRKRANKGLMIALVVVIVLALLAGGGFAGVRIYESQSLNHAQASLHTEQWADAEAAAEKGLSLPTSLLADPLALQRARAEARYHQKKYDQALADFRAVQVADPKDATPYLYQAMILFEQGKLDEALKAGGEAAARDSKLAFPFALQAYKAYQQNKLADALTAANSAIQRDANSELAYRVRGSALAWQYDAEAALGDLDKALNLNPNQPEALAMRAFAHYMRYEDDKVKANAAALKTAAPNTAASLWVEALVSLSNHDEDKARELLDQAIQKDPSRPEYYLYRARSAYKTEQLKSVLADYDQALKLNPDFAPAVADKAMFLFAQYKPVDLEAEANRLLKLAPKANFAHILLAEKYARAHEWQKAVEAADKAIAAQPSPIGGYIERGSIYLAQREMSKASADYQKALELYPRMEDAYLGLATAAVYDKKYDEAAKQIDKAAEIDADSIGARVARAYLYLAKEENTKARKEVEEALKRDPAATGALLARAQINMAENNALGALTDVNKAAEAFPDDPNIVVLRAVAYLANKDAKTALAELEKVEKMDRLTFGLYTTRAQAYLAQIDSKKAMDSARKAVEQEPWNASAYGLLGQAELVTNKVKDGIDHLKTSLEKDPDQRYLYYVLGMAQWSQGDVESALVNLQKMKGMKGKLDMQMIDNAEQVMGFLKTVPVAKDGRRTVNDSKYKYSLTYPVEFVPQLPTDTPGAQYGLSPVGNMAARLEVQITELPADIPVGFVTPTMMSDSVKMVMAQNGNRYTFTDREMIQANGTQGVADTFEYTEQDKDGTNFPMKGKMYIFISGRTALVLIYITPITEFDKYEKMADQVAATVGFLQ